MLYYNTVSNIMRIYSGSAWENVAVSTAGFATLTGVETLTNKTLTAPKIANGGFVADANGNEQIKFTTTASAVNELTVVNSATSSAPEISSTGGDTDIDLKITPKGSGKIVLDGISFPNADGTANQVLTTNGSGVLSFADAFTGLEWQSTIVTTSTLTAVANKGYWIDTTSNACTVTLPASASVGDQIILVDYDRTWNTNNLTININSLNYQGGTDNPVYDTNGQTVNIVYSGATNGWIPISDDDVADEGTIPPVSIDFLVIAGGGGGGGGQFQDQYGGGAGAGGYRTSSQTINVGTAITVTVGGGGPATQNSEGTNGVDSSISGTGITTITSAGGGYGGCSTTGAEGGDGGSGGGTSSNISATAGLGNTPSTSPSQGNNGGTPTTNNHGGGGGGAGATGGNGSGNTGGAGGVGIASSITGSSVTRAGGGAGAGESTGGTGGTGGGGNGSGGNGTGSAGTVNTGGGGGGGGSASAPAPAPAGGAGGSGVVILSMPDADYSGTTTGSPTVATGVSGKTVLTFNGDGSYTV
jgi:hypothetical protein